LPATDQLVNETAGVAAELLSAAEWQIDNPVPADLMLRVNGSRP
jgi:hypothetical protein